MRHYYTIPGSDFQEITPARKCHPVMMSNCKLMLLHFQGIVDSIYSYKKSSDERDQPYKSYLDMTDMRLSINELIILLITRVFKQ